MTVLVIGAGYTGRRCVDRLATGTAIPLGRSLPGDGRLDLDAGDPLPIALPEGYSVIYTVPPAAGRASRSAPADDTGEASLHEDPRLQHLFSRLVPPPGRFVYLSTTGVYGDHRGERVVETDAPRPATGRATRRAAAERQLVDWCTRHGTELVLLRVPGIYGPGRLGTERLREGLPVLAEADANPGNRIHVDDLASCCIAALSPSVPAGIYNVGDGDDRSSTWFASEVARQAGLPLPPTVTREEAFRTFPEARLSFLRESRRLDTTKMRTVLGVTPKYADAAAGIAASLAEEADP